MQVYVNGILAFGNPLTKSPSTLETFSVVLNSNPVAAPFWAAVDPKTIQGTVYYKQLTRGYVLDSLSNDINAAFNGINREGDEVQQFNATFGFLITWHSMSFFQGSSKVVSIYSL